MTDCNICAEKYNKSFRLSVKCICGFECCRSCIKQYFLTKSEDLHCMKCRVKWNRDFMFKHFEKKYMTYDYCAYRENILYEKELGLLPLTQPHVEKEIKIEEINNEILDIEKEICNLNLKMREKNKEIEKMKNNTIVERRKYIRKCPQNDCQGFLSSQLKCNLCCNWVCGECREIKGKERDSEHTCNPDILESVNVMNQDSKPCPSCASLIYKIEGCNQMFCTECNTAFNWSTLRIETAAMHKPHYFEWQRRINSNQQVDRNPGEVICGRELDHHFVRVIKDKYVGEYNTKYKMSNEVFVAKMNDYINEHTVKIEGGGVLKNIVREVLNVPEIKGLFPLSRDSYYFISLLSQKITNRLVRKNESHNKAMNIFVDFIKTLPYYEFEKKITQIENIVRRVIHIREVEIGRFPIGDRIVNNLDLRISFMRNRMSAENMKKEIQKRDKKLQRNIEIRNILLMFVSCITDLFYRINENISEYDNILNEMNELRIYTNECMTTTFTVYGSSMRHKIGETYIYEY